LGFALFLGRSFFPPESIPTGADEAARFTVVIDAGHGGRDGGAVADDGTLEKDLNLAVAKKLAEMLLLSDVRVVMTRTEDIELASPSSDHKKRDDLNARLAITESHENAILVSIHMNKFPVSRYKGLQVYYSSNHEGSLTLAEQIQTGALSLNGKTIALSKRRGIPFICFRTRKFPLCLWNADSFPIPRSFLC
jgi:N-acetylmuramoyl-L-alanine amidase